VLRCRLYGRVRCLVAHIDFSLGDGDLVADDDDTIPTFDSPEAARAFAARRFPEMAATTEQPRDNAIIRKGLEEMYGASPIEYDLDRAAAWATRPAPETAGPSALLEAWRLLAWAGVAPEPARFDPMGLAGLHMGLPAGAALPEPEALIATGMKLDGMVREQQRRQWDAPADDRWLDLGDLWSAADAERVATVLRAGIPAFAARLGA
jgi:hypothetical protein